MENYKKGKNVEEELTKEKIPIEKLPENFLWMHVKGGTQILNVVDYAEGAMKRGDYLSVVWSGSAGGVPKTISCVEIMKRNQPQLHQVTRLTYQIIEEYWEPVLKGLDQIVVTRRIPSIHVLLTLDPNIRESSNFLTKAISSGSALPKENSDYARRNKKNNFHEGRHRK